MTGRDGAAFHATRARDQKHLTAVGHEIFLKTDDERYRRNDQDGYRWTRPRSAAGECRSISNTPLPRPFTCRENSSLPSGLFGLSHRLYVPLSVFHRLSPIDALFFLPPPHLVHLIRAAFADSPGSIAILRFPITSKLFFVISSYLRHCSPSPLSGLVP